MTGKDLGQHSATMDFGETPMEMDRFIMNGKDFISTPDTDEIAIATTLERMEDRERAFVQQSQKSQSGGSTGVPSRLSTGYSGVSNATVLNGNVPLSRLTSAITNGYVSPRQYMLSASHMSRQGSGLTLGSRIGDVPPLLMPAGEKRHGTSNTASTTSYDFDQNETIGLRELKHYIAPRRYTSRTDDMYMKACSKCGLAPGQTYLKQVSKSRSVSMSNCSLSPAACKPIAISLVRDLRVHTLDLSGNAFGPLGVMYIAEMLLENQGLYSLDLSGTNPGKSGLEVLADRLPQNRSLHVLKLESNNIDHKETHYIVDIIHNSFCLSELYLGHNNLGYESAKLLGAELEINTTLRVLDLKWNHFRRESAKHLCNALRENHGLFRLNLGWNGIGKEGCFALARALPKNNTLRDLDLTNNRIDVVALPFLLHGLVRNKRLNVLTLNKNPMTTEGAKAIVRALTGAAKSDVRQLNLEDIPVDQEFSRLVKGLQDVRTVDVVHNLELFSAIEIEMKEHDPHDLNRFDPVMVLIEYTRIDNLRLIDLFQFFDTKNRGLLSRSDLREGVATLGLPLTEYHLDCIMKEVDKKKDGYIDLEELMIAQRDMQKIVVQRTTRAKGKGKEDIGLKELRKILKELVEKRNQRNKDKAAKKMNSSWTGAVNKVKAVPKEKPPTVEEVPNIQITKAEQVILPVLEPVAGSLDPNHLAVTDLDFSNKMAWATPRDA